jgi:2'-5' RNA ligase
MKLEDLDLGEYDPTAKTEVFISGFVAESDEDKDEDTGAFVGVKFSATTIKALTKMIKTLGVPNPTETSELHTTVMYTKSDVPDLLDMDGQSFDPPLTATVDKFEIFNTQDDHDCLVLLLKSDELSKRHEEIKSKYGAVYTHPDYKPHITLSYNADGFDLDQANAEKGIDTIEIIEEYVSPLNSDWV